MVWQPPQEATTVWKTQVLDGAADICDHLPGTVKVFLSNVDFGINTSRGYGRLRCFLEFVLSFLFMHRNSSICIYIYTLSTIRGRVNPQWLEGFLERLSCSQRVKVLTSALHTSNDTGDMNPGHGATKSLVQRGYPNPRDGKGTSWLTRYV